MIFTRTKRTAQKVADELAERGFKGGAVHGDLGQVAREKAPRRSATVTSTCWWPPTAARGIDIDDITHVINYQIPDDEQGYVHRIGRTGRAGKPVSRSPRVDWDELSRWTMIDKALGPKVSRSGRDVPSSPHLFRKSSESPRTQGFHRFGHQGEEVVASRPGNPAHRAEDAA